MKLSFGISVNSDLTNDLWGEKHDTHTHPYCLGLQHRLTSTYCSLFLGYAIIMQHWRKNPRLNQQVELSMLRSSLQWAGFLFQNKINRTYKDVISRGKLRGMSPALSHSALSLEHVHTKGQRGGLGLLLSTRSITDATTSKPSQSDLLGILCVCSILEIRSGHNLRVEQPYT